MKSILLFTVALVAGLSMLLAAACASGGPKHVEVAVKLEETGMTPSVVRAKQGDTVTLKFQANETGNLHLHGYDIEKEVVFGGVTDLEFTATATGRFKITFHAHASGHQTPPGGTPEEKEKEVGFLEVLPR